MALVCWFCYLQLLSGLPARAVERLLSCRADVGLLLLIVLPARLLLSQDGVGLVLAESRDSGMHDS